MSTQLNAQNSSKLKKDTLTVYGICEMCKTRIENAVNALEGVAASNWNEKTKVLMVMFEPSKLMLKEIHAAVSKIGYRTPLLPAEQSGYDKLPYCCREKGACTPIKSN